MDDPVFLLSCARSGSTLLRVMLAGHSSLFCPPELNLLPFETMSERDAKLGACRMQRYRDIGLTPAQGLQRALMELQATDADSTLRLIDTWIQSQEPVARVYARLCELALPRRLVDKSPFYAASVETLRRAEQLFNRPLYIYLFRHPYAVIRSLVRNRFRPSPNRDLFRAGESLWTSTNSNILRFLANIEKHRQVHIQFEALVGEPAQVMVELCSFLDLPFEKDVLRPYDGRRMTDGVSPDLPALGDVDFERNQSIDPRMGDCWKAFRLPILLTNAAPVARDLGYALPAESEAGTI